MKMLYVGLMVLIKMRRREAVEKVGGVRALETNRPVFHRNSALPLSSYVATGKSLNLSWPQFPHM